MKTSDLPNSIDRIWVRDQILYDVFFGVDDLFGDHKYITSTVIKLPIMDVLGSVHARIHYENF